MKIPIREELFSVERLEEHARSLALAQTVSTCQVEGTVRSPDSLPTTARRCSSPIAASCARSTRAAPSRRRRNGWSTTTISSNAKFANFARTCRRAITASFPSSTAGPFAGYPRVFGLTWAFVAHTDSSFDSEMLVRYVLAYQGVQPLTIGELWAISITLRIVLVENLARLPSKSPSTSRPGRRRMAGGPPARRQRAARRIRRPSSSIARTRSDFGSAGCATCTSPARPGSRRSPRR